MLAAPEPALAPKPSRARLVPTLMLVGGAVLALSTAIAWMTYPAAGDRPMDAAALQARAQRFQQAGALKLQSVPTHERATAIQALDLPVADRAALLQQVDTGKTELVRLTLWDDCDQDGDVVSIASDGFRVHVTLTHAPQRIVMPRPAGGVITIGGVHDGGGGITIAAATSAGQVALPVMTPGQLLGIPVR